VISEKNSGPVVVALPGSVMSAMEEKTASRTGSVHPGISHSSTKKEITAYCLAGTKTIQYTARHGFGRPFFPLLTIGLENPVHFHRIELSVNAMLGRRVKMELRELEGRVGIAVDESTVDHDFDVRA
jgi:hypothetical protein